MSVGEKKVEPDESENKKAFKTISSISVILRDYLISLHAISRRN